MNQKYLVARVGTLGECVIHADTENVASFIARYSRGGDIIMATLHLYPLLTTRGEFIDRCYDQDFLKEELLQQLIPLQMGESEPGEIRYPETREDFQGNPAPIPNWDCSTGHGIFNLLDEIKPNRRWRPAYLKEILATNEDFKSSIEEKIQRRFEWQEKKVWRKMKKWNGNFYSIKQNILFFPLFQGAERPTALTACGGGYLVPKSQILELRQE